MDLNTADAQGFGQTWKGGNPEHYVKGTVANVVENKHIEKAQRMPSNKIPEALVQEMFSAINMVCFK